MPNGITSFLLLDRGYTGHEHLLSVGLVHMNGRLYDPVLHRFLQPDNYVQDPMNSQNYNRYGYCWNNPLRFSDPSGEWFWFALAAVALFTTDIGYDIQKFISPVAIKIDIKLGSHQIGLGADISVGLPTALPFSYRENWGATYFWKNYGDYKGWETRRGYERSFFSLYHTGHTNYTAGEFTQTVGYKKIGLIPSFAGIEVTNDLWGDGGDRFRTAHQKINIFGLTIGNIIFTGDPSVYNNEALEINGRETYNKGPYGANKYSAGVFYLGIGNLRIGWDSEGIRNFFQNVVAHDYIAKGSPYIYRTDRKPRFYWFFGNGMW